MDGFGSDPRQNNQLANALTHAHTHTQGPSHAELLMTANDLYARLESDPSFAEEDAYWSSLPLHLQTYVRNILPFSTASKGGKNNYRLQTSAWLQAAQQACDCPACRQGRSLSTLASGTFPGSYPADPSMLSDPNFAAIALENLPLGTSHPIGDHPLDHLSASDISMFNTFANNPNAYDDGVPGYPNSLDGDDGDMDDLDVEVDVDVLTDRHSASAQFTLSYDGSGFPRVNGNHLDVDSAGKKNKKKKKKKGAELPLPVAAPQPVAPVAAPAPTAPPSFPVPPVPTTQPHLNPPPTVAHSLPPSNPVPAPSVHPAPPARQPSSRAAGKQPMAYPPNPPPAPSPAPPATTGRRANSKLHYPLDHHSHAGAVPGAAAAKAEPAKSSKLWNTNSMEERERIKEFWLGLQENERRALVKVEKDTVLKKMKEQQKHSCSCAVCGRKRRVLF
ncbi:hypothetical protein CALVIDRAFT_78901 [Calocera viscosa TUFC12733]|uniref:Stress response protein NST1 n=1 Tax=Calocera viscosa (strain TUFC12733) TaxID=1330018 RepID=A0A167NG78_CALVF|nr:hypothetical protein CALVIDRAFT_78901 [Calocera viscosa TUFC12733]